MIILADKPQWYTSFDVVEKIKRLYPKAKVGHAGTLDPMATGLLIVAVGKDTKKLSKIQGVDKDYTTTIDFSKISDTWDLQYWKDFTQLDCTAEGVYNQNGNFIEKPNIENIKEMLDSLIPEAELPVPFFSAKKIEGKKMYELAREGTFIEKYETMKIFDYEILDYSFPLLKLKITVGSGTFIRSLAYWLGKQFDIGGVLTDLRRTRVGDYKL